MCRDDLLQVDPYVAYHLWVLVFPIVWATLAKQQQINLAKPIISLLSKEYHQRQAMARPNVVQALLEGISLSQPQPKIPPELIKFLGKSFNAWHIAIPLLESHVIIFPDETRCFDALAELYKLVSYVVYFVVLALYLLRQADTNVFIVDWRGLVPVPLALGHTNCDHDASQMSWHRLQAYVMFFYRSGRRT